MYRLLIGFIGDPNQPLWRGIFYASLMFLSAFVQSMLLHQYFHRMFRCGMNIKSVLTAAIFTKSLRLSNASRKDRTVGEIVNLMSVDVQRFQDLTNFAMSFISAPFQVRLILQAFLIEPKIATFIADNCGHVLSLARAGRGEFGGICRHSINYSHQLLPVGAYACTASPTNEVHTHLWKLVKSTSSISCRFFNGLQIHFALFPYIFTINRGYKDERLKMMSEVLNGMKVLKLYAWEASMEERVRTIRQKEMNMLKRMTYWSGLMQLTWSSAPILVGFSFQIYVDYYRFLRPRSVRMFYPLRRMSSRRK
jgi:ABC-type multidrug transport system fused ATPase/permease subunit